MPSCHLSFNCSTRTYLFSGILALMLLPCHLDALGQQRGIIDSLNAVIRSDTTTDTTRVLALTDLAFQYRTSQPDTCIVLAREALRESQSLPYRKGVGRSENVIGLWHYNLNRYDSAYTYFNSALTHLEAAADLHGRALTLNNLGLVLELQGSYPQALTTYLEAQRLLEGIGDEANQSITLNNIALLLLELDEYAQAIEYLERNIALDSSRGDCEGTYFAYNNLGIAYSRLGKRDDAMRYFGRGLAEAEACESAYGQTMTHYNIGDMHLEQGALQDAEMHYVQSLGFAGQLQDVFPELYPLAGLAKVAFAEKAYNAAIQYAIKGYKRAETLNATTRLAAFSQILYQSHKALGNYASALNYLEQYKLINDSLFSIEKHKSLSEINLRYEIGQLQRKEALERAEREAAELQMEVMRTESALLRRTLWLLGLGLLLLIAAGLYGYLNLRATRRKNAIIEQQKSEIEELNQNLAQKIEERTVRLVGSNKKLKEYTFHNAHIVRAPLANILALVNLLNQSEVRDDLESREELTTALQQATEQLDDAVHRIQDVVREGQE